MINNRILVTGAAGFIGFHLCKRLLDQGAEVVGIDNLNDYYDVNLKHARLRQLEGRSNFTFEKSDISDRQAMGSLFSEGSTLPGKNNARGGFSVVVHLAAQAGVRYSITNPHAYIDSNIVGFMNILEGCRHNGVGHLVYASSSSVYGANTKMPFSIHHNVDHPVSLYAATKKANELMAHTYASLYKLPCTGLRFFTVYGPWGRPDMALFLFTKAILEGRPIDVFNYGKMQRDFTYVDDIIEGVVRVMGKIPGPNPGWTGENPDPGTSYGPYKVYNIGNNNPVELMTFIETIEKCLGRTAKKNLLPLQAGDVPATYADVDDLMKDVGFKPATSVEEGIGKFVEWYLKYYKQ
ncbi:MAG: UDP-glucose 4-epimerase [Syntrophorhabdus sp. PtaU1.Bin153]|nr:MAG: UDP-glucose 4-epimerase [Syntrophorhabdus sp. PtaU1.Bin153]